MFPVVVTWASSGLGVPSATGRASAIAGMRMMNSVPWPGALWTLMLPPWLYTMRWQMARPSPVPFSLVV